MCAADLSVALAAASTSTPPLLSPPPQPLAPHPPTFAKGSVFVATTTHSPRKAQAPTGRGCSTRPRMVDRNTENRVHASGVMPPGVGTTNLTKKPKATAMAAGTSFMGCRGATTRAAGGSPDGCAGRAAPPAAAEGGGSSCWRRLGRHCCCCCWGRLLGVGSSGLVQAYCWGCWCARLDLRGAATGRGWVGGWWCVFTDALVEGGTLGPAVFPLMCPKRLCCYADSPECLGTWQDAAGSRTQLAAGCMLLGHCYASCPSIQQAGHLSETSTAGGGRVSSCTQETLSVQADAVPTSSQLCCVRGMNAAWGVVGWLGTLLVLM